MLITYPERFLKRSSILKSKTQQPKTGLKQLHSRKNIQLHITSHKITHSHRKWFNLKNSAIQVLPTFLISDIRALWRSALSARVPECQKLKM